MLPSRLPDAEGGDGAGCAARRLLLAGPSGQHHHGDGAAPRLPQLLPEDPACSAGPGRPPAQSLETLHSHHGEVIPVIATTFTLIYTVLNRFTQFETGLR